MANESADIIDPDIYKGLKALSELSFPKACNTCGQRYENVDEFISQTEAIRQSTGLKEDLDDDDTVFVGLFRNCVCGSTLMDEFADRRNLTKNGVARREKFGELLDKLGKQGIAMDVARTELLKIMRGEGSKILKVKAE